MKRTWYQVIASFRSLVATVRAHATHLTGNEQMVLLAVLALFLLGLTVRTIRMALGANTSVPTEQPAGDVRE